MLKTITLKDVATYNSTGTEISNLAKINFIYGANGSGKTTLSNFLANEHSHKFRKCSIQWQDARPINTLVYNKEFRDKNFGKDSLDGIFTLGEATQEQRDLILQKQKDLADILEDGKRKKVALDSQTQTLLTREVEFKEWCWTEIYKKNEDHFKEAFTGSQTKVKFRIKLLKEYENNQCEVVSLEKLQLKSKTVFGEIPQSMPLTYNIAIDKISSLEINTIWTKSIVGKSSVNIAELIQKFQSNDWVNQGRKFIGGDDDICPFCQESSITDDFRKQIESYFDETFTESIKIIEGLCQEYTQEVKSLLEQLKQLKLNQKNNSLTKLDIDKFSNYLTILESQFISNKGLLSNKLKEPSRSITLVSTQEQLQNIYEIIEKANTDIKAHNQIVTNYKSEKENLINLIWQFLVDKYKDEIQIQTKNLAGLVEGISNIDKQHKAKQKEWTILNNYINELTKNVTGIEPTILEINRILKFYGFINFEIVPSKDDTHRYQIKRENGDLAEATLSEGEITFITFLYYLQLTKGSIQKDNVSEDRVLVIDDPISSLDSDVLFVVSSLIQDIIQNIKDSKGNIKQLIVLTHNVYFHKEISFVGMRDNGGDHTNYWIVRKNNNISTFTAYKRDNPIQTSYQLLWQELIDKEKNSIITIQNTMRRIIENYFKILGNYQYITLIEQFTSYEEQIICKSLISWINDGSHSISDDLYIEIQDTSINKYLDIFKRIFEVSGHQGHYNMMMKI